MQKQGTVIRWDATRGFGFIRSQDTPGDVFFHARDFRSSEPPCVGLAVLYQEIRVGGKGPRAMAVQPHADAAAAAESSRTGNHTAHAARAAPHGDHAAPPAHQRSHAASPPSPRPAATRRQRRRAPRATTRLAASGGLAWALALSWAALLAWGMWSRQLPMGLTLAGATAVNAATFWAYAADKNAAMQGHWRTPESQLHLLSLAGGWPAAWLAQQAMRHKSSKRQFRTVYWLTVLLHCAALALWVARPG